MSFLKTGKDNFFIVDIYFDHLLLHKKMFSNSFGDQKNAKSFTARV
jgi:hypothetical protein